MTTQKTRLYDNKQSLTGKYWQLRPRHDRMALTLCQNFDLPSTAGEILAGRGLTTETLSSYLSPTLRELMPDPSHLHDMNKAVDRIINALRKKEKIAVFGDYDVDGATSSALLKRYFHDVGYAVHIYIPDRIDEGYGPNSAALRQLKQEGYGLILMVDCGTTAFEPLTTAVDIGLDVIVIDHHTAQPALPPAVAVINPNRLDENSPLTDLCAAGMAFMLVVALHRALKQMDESPGLLAGFSSLDLRQYLDLVALGTVCDVMPLTGLNRALVTQGLKIMRQRNNIGLAALADIAALTEPPSAYHLGFQLGPRINAGGRVGQADLGARLLSTRDPIEARAIAIELDQFNKERQEIEADVTMEAYQQIERFALHKNPVIVVQGERWHPGVIGIVASRVKEKFSRPVCIVSFDEQHMGKGSGRSITGVHLGSAMHAAHHHGLLEHGGGHAMAAGFSLLRENYTAFHDFLQEKLGPQVALSEPVLDVDALLSPSGATEEILNHLQLMEPFGAANPTPKFILQYVKIGYAEKIGVNHVRCQLVGQDGTRLKGMAFRALDSALGQALLSQRHKLFHVAGTLKLDTWGGRREMSCMIDDLMEV